MAFQQQPTPAQQIQQQAQDWVPGEQYRYALTNFRIAHEKVEQQRLQLEEQEKQVAQLRTRIKTLEGESSQRMSHGATSSVDDFSIKTSASQLDKLINRWASDIVRSPPASLSAICQAILADVNVSSPDMQFEASSMQAQSLLRHALSETISEGIINCLIVTNSTEANVQLTRLHEHIFAKDPTVASVWRRQTFSAAVESCTPDMSLQIMADHVPELAKLLQSIPSSNNMSILNSAYDFSRMLHGASTSSSGDAFYRAFVPELGSPLLPRQIELVKRCMKSERGEQDRVGATLFPGLVKLTKGPTSDNVQTVVRRAQVVCECAVNGTGAAYSRTVSLASTGGTSFTGVSPPPPPQTLLFSQ